METNFNHDELTLIQELAAERCKKIEEGSLIVESEADKLTARDLKEKVDWYLRRRGEP